jgi:hypothetical protein
MESDYPILNLMEAFIMWEILELSDSLWEVSAFCYMLGEDTCSYTKVKA